MVKSGGLLWRVTVSGLAVFFASCTTLELSSPDGAGPQGSQTKPLPYRRLPVAEYVDKMKAGWVGQMAGVGWGAPTEFKHLAKTIPEDEVPRWRPKKINQFHQDDLYVEMTFLRTLEVNGVDVSARVAGLDFANSRYPLWHANKAGRDNLRKGIAPPDSGHPALNSHADDIDYQIEADFSGLIAPGLPRMVIELGEKFGTIMNYGDGVYGGLFVGGMYSEAFFEEDPERLVEAGLACIPRESQYHECISDVLRWYREDPRDWQETWKKIQEKYHDNASYRRFSCSGADSEFNIDAKLNGAYIAMGLLYGGGDLDKTCIISMRCGQDSDCNPSNALGILCTTRGLSNLPKRYVSALDTTQVFSHTEYSYTRLVEVCEALARKAVARYHGHVEKTASGEEVFLVPALRPEPGAAVCSWEAGPAAGARFTPEEMAVITAPKALPDGSFDLSHDLERFAPGWAAAQCGWDMDPRLAWRLEGRKGVLVTHPLNETTPCVLRRTLAVPPDGHYRLHLEVGHHPDGDWVLVVKVNDAEHLRQTIGDSNLKGWQEIDVPLRGSPGESLTIELFNQPSGWFCEAAYWAAVKVLDSEGAAL